MPQFRQNIILKEWVVIATERAKRPEQLKEHKAATAEALPAHDENCPFCPKTAHTHEEKEFLRVPEKGAWKLRAVANRYPALEPPGDNIHVYTEGFFRWMDGVGHHEVIVETPRHNTTLATMTVEEVETVVAAYRTRYVELSKMDYIETIIPFRNHGPRAGASIPHPHSQIIALPVIPRDVMTRLNEAIRYHEEHRGCVFCKVMNNELEVDGIRLVRSLRGRVTVPYVGVPKEAFIRLLDDLRRGSRRPCARPSRDAQEAVYRPQRSRLQLHRPFRSARLR